MLSRLAVLTTAATLLVAAPAFAQVAPPTLVSPSKGKSITHGKVFTFKVTADVPDGTGVFMKVSKSKKVGDDGTLANDIYFRAMKLSGGSWVKKVERYAALTSHFLNRPGKYYWQAYSIDCSEGTDDCNIESEIRTFRIK
jgi:hypothetical protein